MKFTTALAGALALVASAVPASAAPSVPHEKRQSATIVTTGVTGNGVQLRRELRDMQRNFPDQFNVYLLGLRRMMAVPQNNLLSYYQVAGIHGRPYVPYDGENSQAGQNGYGGGYCPHASNIFLPWHRPYLALYEQTLYRYVNDVANEFPNDGRRARYQAAANNFRIPYWDWAAGVCSECLPYPKLVSQMYLDVDTPNGRQTLMNPLFRYNFTNGAPTEMAYQPFATWTWTRRYPSSSDPNNAWSQNDLLVNPVRDAQYGWRGNLYDLMSVRSFTGFSMSAYITNPINGGSGYTGSLEGIHDGIHSLIGSGGSMTYLDYSAFDPIFFLHHAMVDRVWTLWSAVRPISGNANDDYVNDMRSPGSTYMYQQGTNINRDTPLWPFHRDSSRRLWTSNDVRSTTTFGYAYPEGTDRNTVVQAVRNLYSSGRQGALGKRSLSALSKRSDDHHYQYIANIASQKFQMNGTYAVHVFLGDPPAAATANDYYTAKNLVGTHAVLANMPSQDNRMIGRDLMVAGVVKLTDALAAKCDAGELEDMTPEKVTAYLEQNMEWRVVKADGTIYDSDDVPGLSVSVVTSDVRPPVAATDMPIWGHFTGLPEITVNKKGGHKQGMWDFPAKWSLGELVDAGMKSGKLAFNRKYN